MIWLKKNKRLAALIVVFYVFFVALFSVRIPGKEIVLKGGLTLTSDIITVDETYLDNQFYTVYVLSMDRPTLFQYIIASLDKKIDIENIHKGYTGYTIHDYYKMGQIDEALSFQNALITAYKKASNTSDVQIDLDLEGYIVTYLDRRQIALELGDLLISVNNKEAKNISKTDFFLEFSQHESVNITLIRNGQTKAVVVKPLELSEKYGFNISAKYLLTTLPSVENKTQNDLIGGPSGGLIQTLSIYTDLLNISLKGLKVSGTGTIDSDGVVGPIGGIKQKIYTVASKDVDLFFVPNDNYEEALAAYNTLKNPSFDLIKVGDFDEAVEKLNLYLQSR